ncbi:hypothetical protein T05_13072 [Trichinella murrelli]|uniref:Uncharacterized protein n=1 Tax=Trichinella murrelli TaxID=144512 RepID=A0A0V0T5W5_9BILA|nr:hypothetical protein T05_13072 [Trichinella murrelli]
MNKDNIVDVLKTIEECNIGKNKGNRKCYKTGILSLKMNTKRKLIYLKSLEFLAKRQSCGWHFRYRHPDIAGNWPAHVFTGNTNPLKKKSRIGLFLVRHLVSCPKEEEENLAKMALLFIDRILPMQGEETRWECTKSEFSPCQSMSSQHRKGH